MNKKTTRVFRLMLLILIIGIIFFQLVKAGQEFQGYISNKVWPDRSLDAVSRSADVAYGSNFLAYINFLKKEIPPNAKVVDTRTFGVPQYDDSQFLQYFLLPRLVTFQSDSSCPGISSLKACLQSMAGAYVYFIYGSNFNLSSSVPDTLSVLPFDTKIGVLTPH